MKQKGEQFRTRHANRNTITPVMKKAVGVLLVLALVLIASYSSLAEASEVTFGANDVTVRFQNGVIIRLLNFGTVPCDPTQFTVIHNGAPSHYTLDNAYANFTFENLLAFASGEVVPPAEAYATDEPKPEPLPSLIPTVTPAAHTNTAADAGELVPYPAETAANTAAPQTDAPSVKGKVYADGSIWEGQIDGQGFATGFGKLTTPSEIMVGQMWHDFKHGFGKIWYPNGSDPYYVGYLRYGAADGFGTVYYADGATFSGLFSEGSPVWGRMWWPNNVEYCGFFNPDQYAQRQGYGVETILDTGKQVEAFWGVNGYQALNPADPVHAKSMIEAAYLMTGNALPQDEDVAAWMSTRTVEWNTVDDIKQGLITWQTNHTVPGFDEYATRSALIAMYLRLFGASPEDCVITYDTTRCRIGLTTPEQIESDLRKGGVLAEKPS